MAKEKLFTPEDFDKPTEKKWYQSKGLIITLVILAVVIIVGLLLYFYSNKSGEVSQLAQPNDAVVENVTSSTSEVEIADSSASETVPEGIEQDDVSLPNPAEQVKPEETLAVSISTPKTASNSTEAESLKVIRGDYGNVPQRKELLGTRFNEIQARVNQLKREGKF